MLRLTMVCLTVLLVCTARAAGAADCPTLPPPYNGPIFDANVQAWNPKVDGLVAAADSAGVKRIAFFANSKGGDQTETAKAVLALAQAHPDLFVLGAPKVGFITSGDLARGFIGETVTGVRNGTYKFVGEILYTHGDKPDHPPTRTGDIYVDPGGAGTKQLLAQLAPFNVPLLTHFEAWAWDRDKAHFDQLYAAWPQQRFVIPSVAYGSADKMEAMLSAHPNVWATISRIVDGRFEFVDPAKAAKLGPVMFDRCGALLPEWLALLTKHSDKLMYGSDYYANQTGNWFSYFGVIDRYRRIAGQLPPDVAARISWDNAAALFGLASSKSMPPP